MREPPPGCHIDVFLELLPDRVEQKKAGDVIAASGEQIRLCIQGEQLLPREDGE